MRVFLRALNARAVTEGLLGKVGRHAFGKADRAGDGYGDSRDKGRTDHFPPICHQLEVRVAYKLHYYRTPASGSRHFGQPLVTGASFKGCGRA